MTSSLSTDVRPSLPRGLGLAAFSGLLYFLGFVGFGQFYLTWLCFVPVLWAVRNASGKRAILLGAIFGLVTNLGGYYWVIHLLTQFADLNVFLATLGYGLLCAYQGFLLALVIGLVQWARARLRVAPVWSLPVAFVALELTYPLLFPSYIGNSQYRFTALTQVVEITGMLGLTAVISLVNGALYEVVEARRGGRSIVRRRVVVPASILVACLAYGAVRIPMVEKGLQDARTLDVAIVQTNLGARDKAAQANEFIRRHRVMSQQVVKKHPELDLIVWPESAYNRWIPRSADQVGDNVTKGIGRPVLFGALTYEKSRDGGHNTYNSAVLADAKGRIAGIFDKVVLLMFGETIPFVQTFPSIRKWFPRSSVFTPGRGLSHLPLDDRTSLLTMICYEDIIPSFVRGLWDAAGPAELLVNITNDSWYGDTHEPLIHLVLATFRTIETRRALVRSTNTGISAIVDPLGRITHRTGQWTQEVLVATVPVIDDDGSTIYQAIGDALGWIAVALIFAGWILARRRR